MRGAGSNISLDSVGSSGGWNGVSQLISQADEEAKEEEKILNELKDAKVLPAIFA